VIKIIPIQEAYQAKIERQKELKGLKFKCHGSCAFVGQDISPGCYGCFYSDAFHCSFMLGRDFGLANVCNRDCPYCFEPHEVGRNPAVADSWRISPRWKDELIKQASEAKPAITTDSKMQYYEFSGACEPLLYIPVLAEWMRFFRDEVDPIMGTQGWAKVYTNGTLLNPENILKLKQMGFDEVRVHLGASNFSKDVYRNIKLAVKQIPTLTVETPAWPLHREQLFQMLPVIEEMGVKHLNICQVEITSDAQLRNIETSLGEVSIYQAFYPVMDDAGLVEDIMREHLEKGYAFSLLDCNGFVKQSRSALSDHSYWNRLNRKYPPEWEKQRHERRL
jgi:pyruvate formate-lyase activating enzyme-like uncharacterized protein